MLRPIEPPVGTEEIPAAELKEGSVCYFKGATGDQYGFYDLTTANFHKSGWVELEGTALKDEQLSEIYEPIYLPTPNHKFYAVDEPTVKRVRRRIKFLTKQHPLNGVTLRQWDLGTDPEIFLAGADGNIIPAYTVLPAQADAELDGYNYCDKVYNDGFQAEMNTRPVWCIQYVADGVQEGMCKLLDQVRATHPNVKLNASPVIPISLAALADAPEAAVIFGCMPSKNVYGLEGRSVANPRTFPFRFAGFHMHTELSKKWKTPEHIKGMVKIIDRICGVLSVVLLEGLEDGIRRKYYGLAGEYRTPKHGLEYRTCSSAVLWHPVSFMLHFELFRIGVKLYTTGIENLFKASDEEVIAAINDLDVDLAKKIICRNRKLIHHCLYKGFSFSGIRTQNETDKGIDWLIERLLLGGGFKDLIELDVEKNWLIGGKWISHGESPGVTVRDFMKTHAY
jgi:hypothetical protein